MNKKNTTQQYCTKTSSRYYKKIKKNFPSYIREQLVVGKEQ
jgi:hypothetical protein